MMKNIVKLSCLIAPVVLTGCVTTDGLKGLNFGGDANMGCSDIQAEIHEQDRLIANGGGNNALAEAAGSAVAEEVTGHAMRNIASQNALLSAIFNNKEVRGEINKQMKSGIRQSTGGAAAERKRELQALYREKGCGSSPATRQAKVNSTVLQVQKQLQAAGYDCGPADGLMGAKTRGALQQFQNDHGLNASGKTDEATLKKLAEIGGA